MLDRVSPSTWELFKKDNHACYLICLDREETQKGYIETNQYLIIHNGVGILLDPGGFIFFDRILKEVERLIDPREIKYIFLSHQDPDITSAILSWKRVASAKFLISKLWLRFISLYGLYDFSVMDEIGDSGKRVDIDDSFYFSLIPAHFLHSPGNFSFYDSYSKILFSGDIGAAGLPRDVEPCGVDDFSKHLEYMEGFHKRYMAGNRACREWVKNVQKYDIQMMAPQHGAIFNKNDTERFLEWFENLECGIDLFKN